MVKRKEINGVYRTEHNNIGLRDSYEPSSITISRHNEGALLATFLKYLEQQKSDRLTHFSDVKGFLSYLERVALGSKFREGEIPVPFTPGWYHLSFDRDILELEKVGDVYIPKQGMHSIGQEGEKHYHPVFLNEKGDLCFVNETVDSIGRPIKYEAALRLGESSVANKIEGLFLTAEKNKTRTLIGTLQYFGERLKQPSSL